MIRGVYSAASAMGYNIEAVGVLAHNLSNAGTAGFKRSELVGKSFPAMMVQMGEGRTSPLGLGVGAEQAVVDMSQGALHSTGRNFDVAIDGEGYFQVRRTNGQLDITRNGSFSVNEKKQLITQGGDLVLGEGDQPIQFLEGMEDTIRISDTGQITESGQVIGSLKMVDAKPTTQGLAPMLKPFVTDIQATGEDKKRSIHQGFLEESNVSIVKEMVALLSSQKNYDVGQKLIQASDKMTDKVINEMGRG